MTAADDAETAVTIALACLATATPRSPLPLGPGGSSGGGVSCHAAGSGTLLCPFNFVVAPAWPGMDRHSMGSLPDGTSMHSAYDVSQRKGSWGRVGAAWLPSLSDIYPWSDWHRGPHLLSGPYRHASVLHKACQGYQTWNDARMVFAYP